MDLATAHATLGVDADTPLADVRSRYRMRAHMLHPDRMGDRPGLKQEAQRAMSDLNTAWEVIEGAERTGQRARPQANRDRPRPDRDAASSRTAATRMPVDGECDLCGVRPAARIELRTVTGMVLAHRLSTSDLDLCRRCGISVFREAQSSTLAKGWWGITGAFATIGVLVANGRAVFKHKRHVADPESRDPNVVTPIPPGMPLAEPVFSRMGSFIAPVAFAGLLTIAGATTPDTQEEIRDTTSIDNKDDPTSVDNNGVETSGSNSDAIGTCMDGDGWQIDCLDPSAAYFIVTRVAVPGDCGYYLTPFTDDEGRVFCARGR